MSRERSRVSIGNRVVRGRWWRLALVVLAWLALATPIVGALIAVGVLRDYAADLPATPDLDDWEARAPRTSVIVAADSTVLAELPFRDGVAVGHRFPVAYAEIPTRMVQAILAAEDIRFFSHRGVDFHAVARAAWANWRAGAVVEGASTITQQVARNLLPEEIGRRRNLRRKVREALLARRIEQRYSKQRIFETYANHAFLGAGAYGIAAAARAYFDRRLDELSLAQTAMIAGLAQAPGTADPYRDAAAARARRDDVLARMQRAGFLADDERRAAQAESIELRPPAQRYGALAPWYTERARRELATAMPAAYDRGGLRIETAAAPALGAIAEDAARAAVAALGRDLAAGAPQVAALVWDHRTGYVEATVGGRSWDDSRFDRATQACRQPGSAFKPIVYAAALEADAITPGTALRDAPIAEYDEATDVHWKPSASGRAFRGVALAQDALAASLNAPAIDVLDRVGADRVIDLAHRLGISSEVADVRPMALGASCVVPLELAGAFATFARGGRTVEPIFVVRVWRGAEVVLDRADPADPTLDPARRLDRLAATASAGAPEVAGGEPDRVLDAATAFQISSMLADVILRGTGVGARGLGRPSAGKTGTTNDNTDAWFVGYTGRIVAAVWVGHDDPKQTLSGHDDGAHAALPLWVAVVRAAEADRPPRAVPGPPPRGLERVRIDRETGLLATRGSGAALELWLKPGTVPTATSDQLPGVPASLGRTSREF